MASVLRPTPETGSVAATRQPASAIGPSWTKRAGREARLALRQAQKRGDREGAMRIALQAEESGLDSQASIGSAERRMAGDVVNRDKDTATTAEIGQALSPPAVRADGQPAPAPTLLDRYRGAQETLGGAQVRAMEKRGPSAVQPPAMPPAPGATEPPENPVTGATQAPTGDAETRLSNRRINPLTGKSLGYDPRNSSPVDTMSRIRELTSADGENLTRGAAIRKVNDERRAAGQTAVDFDKTIDELQADDRKSESTRRAANALNRSPTLSADPTLARSFRAARATPTPQSPIAPSPQHAPQGAPLSAAYKLGRAARQLTPGSLAGRATAAAADGAAAARNTTLDAAAISAAPYVGARRAAADYLGEKVLTGMRRRKQIAEFLRGARTPQR